MTLTKADIIDHIYNTGDFKKGEASRILETLLEIVKSTLESGEDVLISGLGKFCVKDKKARKGRNPQTGEGLALRPRRVITFSCSGTLRHKINGGG